MPIKRIFNSTEPLNVLPVYLREEPFAKKPLFSLRKLKISFVKKFETFRALYETFKGSVQNQYFQGLIARPLKDSKFFTKFIFNFRSEKRGFLAKGSSADIREEYLKVP